ncbi:mitochondrial amidoxime-reducing component 1-like [Haliotis rufescens]|uniref:mitochondrial amidoxime-reducing component 1-like n=1 Tax=Haliotis rufescens TaxID=6454 RepID=UPI001EB04920|nr:mitochondrial amidoxime-reducing component 1-like [Haliotis rufescens]
MSTRLPLLLLFLSSTKQILLLYCLNTASYRCVQIRAVQYHVLHNTPGYQTGHMFAIDINKSPLGLFTFFVIVSAIKLTALGWLRKKRGEMFECVGRVHALYNFPIKSCGAIECQEAEATGLGFSYRGLLDRHLMVIKGRYMLNMKTETRMTLISTTPLGGGDLRLDAPDMPSLMLHTADFTNIISCRIYGVNMDVIDCGDEAASWLNTFLGYDNLRLVHSPEHLTKRDAADKMFSWNNNTREGDMTAFNYLTSYMMTSASSLHDLNQRLDSPVSMLNFRPNIAIEGTPPFDEDKWLEIKIGDSVMMRVADVCRRCPITTVDPATGIRDSDRQPLTKLKTYRCIPPYGSAPVFGVYCALEKGGRVQVGDSVSVLRGTRNTHQALSL